MKLARVVRAFPVALGIAACGGAEEPESTDATTRALLNQITVGGPSSDVAGAGGARQAPGESLALIIEFGYNRGDTAAPLKLIEFSDFSCGYCRQFHQETFPTLEEQFIDTGMIEWKFMSFVSGQFEHSQEVTEAAECALEQDAATYEALGDMLWARQPEWKLRDEPAALVRSWAADLGLDMAEFDACLSADRRVERIAGATSIAQQLGVRGTPTFWIVGYGPLQGALPLETFSGILGTVHAEIVAATPN